VTGLFVYGLLKPGFRLHHLAAPFVVGSVAARAHGGLYDAGVPAARFDEDGDIEGFVLWLDPARLEHALRVLDDVEDEGVEYRRVQIEVEYGARRAEVYAYEYLRPLHAARAVGPAWI
jgi:gamma-glutamylcyclotransferase (GGCT)/AIG2-like uncharacterized protein YtfP